MTSKTFFTREKIGSFLAQILKIASVFLIFTLMLSKPAPILIAVYFMIVAWLCLRLLKRLPIIPSAPINPFLFCVIATLLLSIIAGGDWHEGLRGLNKWIRAILIFWVSYDFFQNRKDEARVMAVFTLVFIVTSLNGLYQYFYGSDLLFGYPAGFINSDTLRVTSSFGYFGMFACFLIMVMPVVVIFIQTQTQKRWQQFLMLAFLILGLVNLYLTRSRGAWVSLILMGVLFCVSQRKKWMLAVLAFSVVAALFALPKDLVFHHRTETGIDKTTDHRFILWGQALNILKANPVAGCGLNTYVKNIKKYNEKDYYDASNYYAHNGYLQHAAETGILGLAALLMFLVRYFMITIPSCFSRKPDSFRQTMILLSISGFLFYMFFDTIFHNLQPFLMLWIFLGWGLAINKQEIRTA